MAGRHMYLFRSDFSSCLESTEIWHADSFCVFFKKAEKYRPNFVKIHPPLCPSPNIVGFQPLRTKTLCMCVFMPLEGGGGRGGGGGGGQKEGVAFQELVWSLVSPLFDTKRVGMPNFSGFQAT